MLSPADFTNLPPAIQAALVLDEGQYLHHRIKGWCKIDLYWFHSYYVELWFLYDLKSIGLVRVLPSKESLDPFLETIQVKVELQE